jgi:hypothetical protein
MRYLLVPFLVACQRPPASAPSPPPATYTFRATGSNETTGTLVEDLIGTAYVSSGRIRVVVARGIAQLEQTASRRPQSLSAGLAYRHPNGEWDFRRQSSLVPVSAIRHKGDTLLQPVEFIINGTAGLDLTAHWLVIQQHRHSLVSGQWHEATRPINSEVDIFRQTPK